jgi:hypothetical protein
MFVVGGRVYCRGPLFRISLTRQTSFALVDLAVAAI